MEPSYSFSSYPDSQNSSPRSRDIDLDSAPWGADDSAAAAAAAGGAPARVKFICSYGGKIQPRAHDNQLSYVGGDTKILAVDRNVRFASLVARLSGLLPADVPADFTVKYQLPGEELDALISVTNDEDLDHLMAEYDRLVRVSPRPARMRLFLFPASSTAAAPVPGKPDSKWLVDAINSAAPIESGPPGAGNPDFLFGLDKGLAPPPPPPPPPAGAAKAADLEVAEVETPLGDRPIGGGEAAQVEIQRQIQEMKRLQLAGGPEKGGFPAKGEYYAPAHQAAPVEKVMPPPAAAAATFPSAVPPAYWSDRQPLPTSAGGFPVTAADQPPVYLIPTAAPPPHGVYSGVRPIPGQVSQGYYTVQQMVQQPPPQPPAEVYQRESSTAVYGLPQQVGPPPTKLAAYAADGGVNMVRAATPPGLIMPELVYGQVAYDRLYYTSTAAGTAVAAPTYQAVAASGVDVRQPAMEGKLANAQTS